MENRSVQTAPAGGAGDLAGRLLRRVELLEGDAELARRMASDPSGDVRDVKWLDAVVRIEGQIQKLYQDLIELEARESAPNGRPGEFTIVTQIPRPGGQGENDEPASD